MAQRASGRPTTFLVPRGSSMGPHIYCCPCLARPQNKRFRAGRGQQCRGSRRHRTRSPRELIGMFALFVVLGWTPQLEQLTDYPHRKHTLPFRLVPGVLRNGASRVPQDFELFGDGLGAHMHCEEQEEQSRTGKGASWDEHRSGRGAARESPAIFNSCKLLPSLTLASPECLLNNC